MLHDAPSSGVRESSMDIAKEFEFIQHGLVGAQVQQDCGASSTLREHNGTASFTDLLEHAGGLSAEVRNRLDVGFQVEGYLRHVVSNKVRLNGRLKGR